MADPEVSVFRPGRPGLRKVLGDLEADIMEVFWNRDPGTRLTVRDVASELEGIRDSAYTTIMTVMGILAKKELLEAEKSSTAHVYEAKIGRDEFTATVVERILNDLMSDFAAPVLAHLSKTSETASALQGWAERIQARRDSEE